MGVDLLSGADQEWIPSLFRASDWLRQITQEQIHSWEQIGSGSLSHVIE